MLIADDKDAAQVPFRTAEADRGCSPDRIPKIVQSLSAQYIEILRQFWDRAEDAATLVAQADSKADRERGHDPVYGGERRALRMLPWT